MFHPRKMTVYKCSDGWWTYRSDNHLFEGPMLSWREAFGYAYRSVYGVVGNIIQVRRPDVKNR